LPDNHVWQVLQPGDVIILTGSVKETPSALLKLPVFRAY
jgi:hypothetical protein